MSIDRFSVIRFSNAARFQIFSLTDFGLWSFFLRMSSKARQGQSASACTIWISNNILVCRGVRGSVGSGVVLITAAHQGGTLSQAVSFDFGIVSALQLSNGPVSFSTTVQLLGFLGAGFRTVAFSLFARNGGSSCQASMWSSNSSMSCRAALGTNYIFRTVVSIAATSTSTSDAFSHDATLSNSAMASSSWVSSTGIIARVCSGAGLGLVLQISASAGVVSAYTEALSYFGVSSYSAASRSMYTAAVATEWSSDSALTIRPSLGFNSRFAPFSVTVQLAKGTRHMKLFTFDSPSVIVAAHRQRIFAVALPPRPNFPTTGHPMVTVLGTNFGLANSSPMTRMGESSSSWTIWQVDTTVVCRAPSGVGQRFGVGVTVTAYSGTLTSCCSITLRH